MALRGGLLLLVIALAVAGYLLRRQAAAAPSAATGPITIGLLHALSGPSATGEAGMVAAARLAVEDINAGGGLLGRRVELRVEDTRGDPRVAAAAAERLITREHAVALFGCGSSACRQAVRPVVEARRHLLVFPAAHEGMEQSPHILYTGPIPNQQALPAIDWALHGFGRRVYLLGAEAPHGRRLGLVLRDFIGLSGGQVLGERWMPPGGAGLASDMAAMVADLQRLRPEVLVSTLGGESNRALFDALVAAGLADLPLLSLGATEPELRAFGGGRLERHFTAAGYLSTVPGAASEAFLARLRRSQGDTVEASEPAVSTYLGLQLWAAAVREVGSPQTDVVNANLLHQTVPGPQGFAAVESASRHLWRQLRIAQVKPDGRLSEVLLLPRHIRPQPWPVFRSTEHWMTLMARTEAAR